MTISDDGLLEHSEEFTVRASVAEEWLPVEITSNVTTITILDNDCRKLLIINTIMSIVIS